MHGDGVTGVSSLGSTPLRRDTVVLSQVFRDPILKWQWQVRGGEDDGCYLAGFATEQDALDYGRIMGWR